MSYPSLPSAEDFYSTLKNENPINSEEDYQQLINVWNNEGMQTFKDYLIYYNNLDTGPFCIALDFFCLFGVLRRFQHCTGHITTGSWKGRGNQ